MNQLGYRYGQDVSTWQRIQNDAKGEISPDEIILIGRNLESCGNWSNSPSTIIPFCWMREYATLTVQNCLHFPCTCSTDNYRLLSRFVRCLPIALLWNTLPAAERKFASFCKVVLVSSPTCVLKLLWIKKRQHYCNKYTLSYLCTSFSILELLFPVSLHEFIELSHPGPDFLWSLCNPNIKLTWKVFLDQGFESCCLL